MHELDIAIASLLELGFRFLPGELLIEDVNGKVEEFLREGRVAPLGHGQDTGAGGIRFDAHDHAACREAVEQLGPRRSELLLIISDELLKAADVGGFTQFANGLDLAEIFQRIKRENRLDEGTRLCDSD